MQAANLIVLVTSADRAKHQPFAVLGDNLGALNDGARLKGKAPLLAVGREIAWRQGARLWRPVFRHCCPAEVSERCDALSRLCDPEAKRFPPVLAGVARRIGGARGGVYGQSSRPLCP